MPADTSFDFGKLAKKRPFGKGKKARKKRGTASAKSRRHMKQWFGGMAGSGG